MKFFFKRNKVLIIVVGVIVILSLNFFQGEVKGFFYFFSSPLQKTFWQAGSNVSDFFEGIFNSSNLKKEVEALKLEKEELLSETVSWKEFQKENEILREALEIGLQKEFRLASAEITSRDIASDLILINQGLREGLLKGMPVITAQKVLLGKITEVYDKFAQVALISNKESSFSAQVVDTPITGVIKGKGALEVYLDLISQNEDIKEGDLVVTSPLGGIYPKGLLVGLIQDIKKSDIKPFYEINVLPFFDIETVENVFIILDF